VGPKGDHGRYNPALGFLSILRFKNSSSESGMDMFYTLAWKICLQGGNDPPPVSCLKIEGACGRVQKFKGKRIKNRRKRKPLWLRRRFEGPRFITWI
jgi:hypothetical protein